MKACSAYADKSNCNTDPTRFDPPESRVEQADLARAVLRSGEGERKFDPAKPGGGSRSLRVGDERTLELARALADAPEAQMDSGVAKVKVARLKKQPNRGGPKRARRKAAWKICAAKAAFAAEAAARRKRNNKDIDTEWGSCPQRKVEAALLATASNNPTPAMQ